MTFLISLLLATMSVQSQETKSVPKDSVEVFARGCLKGRVFTATSAPEDEGVRRGPDIVGLQFRVSAPREVMDEVKKQNGHRVEVVGIVRKAALDDPGIGMKVGGTRVVIGAPGGDPTRMNTRSAPAGVAVMDVTAIRSLADRCSVE
jgi:hypothetical protein